MSGFIEVTTSNSDARRVLIRVNSIEVVEDLMTPATALAQSQISTSCQTRSVRETFNEVKNLIERAGEADERHQDDR